MGKKLIGMATLALLLLSLEARPAQRLSPPNITGVCPQDILANLLGRLVVHGNGFTGATFTIDGTVQSGVDLLSDGLASIPTTLSLGTHSLVASNGSGSSDAFALTAVPLEDLNPLNLLACGPEVTNLLVSAGQVSSTVAPSIITRYQNAANMVSHGAFTGAAESIEDGLGNFINSRSLTQITDLARNAVYAPLNALIVARLRLQEQKKNCQVSSEGPHKIIIGQVVTIKFIGKGPGHWVTPPTLSDGLTTAGSVTVIPSADQEILEVPVKGFHASPKPLSDFVSAGFLCRGESQPMGIAHFLTVLSVANGMYFCTVTSQGPATIDARNPERAETVTFTGNPLGTVHSFTPPTQQNLSGTGDLLTLSFAEADLANDNILTVQVKPFSKVVVSKKVGDAIIRTSYQTSLAVGEDVFSCTALGRHAMTVTNGFFGITNKVVEGCTGSAGGPELHMSSPTATTVTAPIIFKALVPDTDFLGWVTPPVLEAPAGVTILTASGSGKTFTVTLQVLAGVHSTNVNDVSVRMRFKCKVGPEVSAEFIEVVLTHQLTIINQNATP